MLDLEGHGTEEGSAKIDFVIRIAERLDEIEAILHAGAAREAVTKQE